MNKKNASCFYDTKVWLFPCLLLQTWRGFKSNVSEIDVRYQLCYKIGPTLSISAHWVTLSHVITLRNGRNVCKLYSFLFFFLIKVIIASVWTYQPGVISEIPVRSHAGCSSSLPADWGHNHPDPGWNGWRAYQNCQELHVKDSQCGHRWGEPITAVLNHFSHYVP